MERAELARLLGGTAGDAAAIDRPTVVANEGAPEFMAAFSSAACGRGAVFLSDPSWDEGRRAKLGEFLSSAHGESSGGQNRGWLMIPSGGTSGGLKFARHDAETIAAAVRGFCTHFELSQVNAVGLLPLYHVSGLMAWMRCAMTGGTYRSWNWDEIKRGRWPEIRGSEPWVISLVATQLQRLLEVPAAVEWLRRFQIIFLGGGPVWPELAEQAAAANLPVSLSYGMTETAAMVSALRPTEFLNGERSSGRALPHVRTQINDDGVVCVSSESMFRGYFPSWRETGEFETEDRGEISELGHLRIVGRRDGVIITGGKKVQPEEVEKILRASGEFSDVGVVGVADAQWGEAVVACYPAGEIEPDFDKAVAGLSAEKIPKRFVPVIAWPRNAQGKLNRAALIAAAIKVTLKHQA